jgi:hypothetical protein
MPELPPFLSGRELVIVDGAVLGSDERGEQLLAGLRALNPEMDTFARVPATSLVRLHMDPEGGAPFASDSAMLASFPDAAVDAFLAEVGPGRESSLLMAELRQLGGALGCPHEGGGVLNRLDAQFVAFAGGMAITPEVGAAAHADAVRLMEAQAPFANGRQYLNFAENPVDTRSAYSSDVWTQLTGIHSASTRTAPSRPTTRRRGSSRTERPQPDRTPSRRQFPPHHRRVGASFRKLAPTRHSWSGNWRRLGANAGSSRCRADRTRARTGSP